MRIQGMPKEERPREKMIFAGKEALSNSELLAILLRAGTKNKSALQIAAEILSQNESGILYLESCSPEELSEIKGVGMAKACQILAAVELGKRIASHPPKVRKEIENPDDIVQLFMGKMRYYKKEHFKVLLINAKGEILEEHEVSIGDLCSTPVHPREVFCPGDQKERGGGTFCTQSSQRRSDAQQAGRGDYKEVARSSKNFGYTGFGSYYYWRRCIHKPAKKGADVKLEKAGTRQRDRGIYEITRR